ncbi:hypothetical protein [Pseudomonas sp. Leaf48]|uniref:hypothetical protein n=1 Tax=Pseudomonas sp. Leaf48 TaxID=1736221 RepID=UPI0012E963B9|nr:hypothetical protein [Pseudomonas sp. Leaf48]
MQARMIGQLPQYCPVGARLAHGCGSERVAQLVAQPLQATAISITWFTPVVGQGLLETDVQNRRELANDIFEHRQAGPGAFSGVANREEGDFLPLCIDQTDWTISRCGGKNRRIATGQIAQYDIDQ